MSYRFKNEDLIVFNIRVIPYFKNRKPTSKEIFAHAQKITDFKIELINNFSDYEFKELAAKTITAAFGEGLLNLFKKHGILLWNVSINNNHIAIPIDKVEIIQWVKDYAERNFDPQMNFRPLTRVNLNHYNLIAGINNLDRGYFI